MDYPKIIHSQLDVVLTSAAPGIAQKSLNAADFEHIDAKDEQTAVTEVNKKINDMALDVAIATFYIRRAMYDAMMLVYTRSK